MKLNPRRRSSLRSADDSDPLSVVVNLFDVAMVFAVSLMVAIVMHMDMTEFFGGQDFSIVKNPGTDQMEIITRKGKEIERYTPGQDPTKPAGNKGRKVGVAYELDDGRIIYLPE